MYVNTEYMLCHKTLSLLLSKEPTCVVSVCLRQRKVAASSPHRLHRQGPHNASLWREGIFYKRSIEWTIMCGI